MRSVRVIRTVGDVQIEEHLDLKRRHRARCCRKQKKEKAKEQASVTKLSEKGNQKIIPEKQYHRKANLIGAAPHNSPVTRRNSRSRSHQNIPL